MDPTADNPTSPRRTKLPASVRQPVSCEPCRRRKIKCSRTRPPCDTCRRRGCAHNCIYKGSQAETSPNNALASGGESNQGLIDRISTLESLLIKQIGAQIPTTQLKSTSTILSPPTEHIQPLQQSPCMSTPENSSQASYGSISHNNRDVGVLVSLPDGNIRYEPRSSQWSSVLAHTGLVNETPSLECQDEEDVSSGFPFFSSSIASMDELLSLLPPMQQCDYLKNIYFKVFSPVSTLQLV